MNDMEKIVKMAFPDSELIENGDGEMAHTRLGDMTTKIWWRGSVTDIREIERGLAARGLSRVYALHFKASLAKKGNEIVERALLATCAERFTAMKNLAGEKGPR